MEKWLLDASHKAGIQIDATVVKQKCSNAGWTLNVFQKLDWLWANGSAYRCFDVKNPEDRDKLRRMREEWKRMLAKATTTTEACVGDEKNAADMAAPAMVDDEKKAPNDNGAGDDDANEPGAWSTWTEVQFMQWLKANSFVPDQAEIMGGNINGSMLIYLKGTMDCALCLSKSSSVAKQKAEGTQLLAKLEELLKRGVAEGGETEQW